MKIVMLGLLACFAGDQEPRRLHQELSHRRLLERLTKIATADTSARNDAQRPVQDLTDDELLVELSHPGFARRPLGMEGPLEFLAPWQHPAASEITRRCQLDAQVHRWFEDKLDRLQRSPDADASFLAAYILAKLGHADGLETLSVRLLDDRSPVAIRSLAVEALSLHLDRVDPDPLRKLLGQWLGEIGSSVSSLRLTPDDESLATGMASLYALSLAHHATAPPESDPWTERLSRIAIPSVRRAAAMSFAGVESSEVGPTLKRLLADSEPQVRRSALASLLTHPNGAGRAFVYSMTADADLNVAALAIGGLSNYADIQTARKLDELQQHSSAIIRQAVARAAGKLGQESIVLRMLDDKSGEVRAVAAEALARFPTPASLKALQHLAQDDRSTVVQSAALHSLAAQPLDKSMPILLDAMESSSARARETASRLVAKVIPEAGEFSASASPEMRGEQLDVIRRAWTEQAARQPATLVEITEKQGPVDLLTWIRDWHDGGMKRERAQAYFETLSMDELSRIESAILEMDLTPTPEFIEQMLGRFDPAYATLARLNRVEGRQLDQTVVKLLGEWENRRPSLLQRVLVLLAALEVDERALWTRLLPIVDFPNEEDVTPTGAPTILTPLLELVDHKGLQSEDELIRETTLQRMAAGKRSSSSELVAKLMNDPNERVRRAAIQAAGSSSEETLHEDLTASLRHPSPVVQLEAARQLHRMGNEEGSKALRRLIASTDAEIRRGVLAEASLSHHVDREASLRLLQLGLADPKLEVRQQAVKGLENVVGHSQAGSPGRWIPIDQQVNHWKRTLSALLESERPGNPAHDRMKQEAIQRTLDSLPIAN